MSCLLRLGYQTKFFVFSLHLEVSRLPVCSVSRMSECNGGGMMILLAHIRSLFCMVISPATENKV